MIRGFLWAGRRRDGKASGRACGLNRRTRIGIGTGPHRRRPVSDNRPRRHRKPATWSQNLIRATTDRPLICSKRCRCPIPNGPAFRCRAALHACMSTPSHPRSRPRLWRSYARRSIMAQSRYLSFPQRFRKIEIILHAIDAITLRFA